MDPQLNASPAPKGLCVLKFGGSVLTSEEDYAAAGAEIYRHVRAGEKTIVIVSALKGETDTLLAQADANGGGAFPHITARLARLGEFRSAALMGLALSRLGLRAKVLDPHEIGLMAEGDPMDSNLSELDKDAMAAALAEADAVVLPGFTACHSEHGAATLGRGGTDLTAVFFAVKAGANRVRLIKDVDGVYTDDPAKDPHAQRYDALDYDQAMDASRGLIQPKAIEAAKAANLVVEVAAMGAREATRIASGPSVIGRPRHRGPMKVALLGCGAVGSGVLDHVLSHPELFELNPVLVRNVGSRADDRRAVFTSDPHSALAGDPDLVVEMTGGADGPAELMLPPLRNGLHVVTANKAAVAKHFDALHDAARRGGAHFAYSAAVGGGVPMIETVRQLQPVGVAALEGVMNGTANFILSKLGEGDAFEDALAEAQRLGFAEADPSADVEGHDAADKLSILIREAFQVAVPPGRIAKRSLADITPEMCAEAAKAGQVYKQIARARRVAGGAVAAEVVIEPVALDHPFASARNEQNRARVTDAKGEVHAVFGKGAGRWPTAAAVFADMMDIQRASACDRAQRPHPVQADQSVSPLASVRRA
jgi:homoserine dehydrogenase